MKIQLSDHFTYKKLLRLTLPSMIMLVVTSVYSVVDGFFVSNFVGKTPFAAVNLIMPFLMVIGSIGFMMGTGGGALIAKTLGENRREKAGRIFSMVVYLSAALGAVLTVLGLACLRPVALLLGAEGELLENCIRYGRIVLLATPAYILQFEFQCLFATANKPGLGLAVTVAAGLTNAVLDALFVAVLPWGLEGAAAATAIGQCVGGVLPVVYFARENGSLLRLGRAEFDGRTLLQVCLNGSSEMLSNIASSVVGMLYNGQLLRYIGEDGVAAYGVLMYLGMVFNAVFIGFSVGAAPVVSYHYGAGNTAELKNMKKKCFTTVAVFSGAMFTMALLLSRPLAALFVGYDRALFDLTAHAFLVYSVSFLFFGFTICTSSFFTALNNGPVSAAVSFLRTLVFQTAAVFLLPVFFGMEGIWWSVAAAEALALCVSLCFLRVFQSRYEY